MLRPLLLSVVLASAVGCAVHTDEQHLATVLDDDGYALFRVKSGGAERVAVLVDLRDVPEGTYVLLHSPSPPPSVGWFQLDPADYEGCRPDDDLTRGPRLTCMVPGGHGEIVDIVRVFREPDQLWSTAETASRPDVASGVLRHATFSPTPPAAASASSSSSRPSRNEYYAVMRVELDRVPVEIGVEVRAYDDDAMPSVERVPR